MYTGSWGFVPLARSDENTRSTVRWYPCLVPLMDASTLTNGEDSTSKEGLPVGSKYQQCFTVIETCRFYEINFIGLFWVESKVGFEPWFCNCFSRDRILHLQVWWLLTPVEDNTEDQLMVYKGHLCGHEGPPKGNTPSCPMGYSLWDMN